MTTVAGAGMAQQARKATQKNHTATTHMGNLAANAVHTGANPARKPPPDRSALADLHPIRLLFMRRILAGSVGNRRLKSILWLKGDDPTRCDRLIAHVAW